MKAPTVKERAAARKVVAYYAKQAVRIVGEIDQEQSSEWCDGLRVVDTLLRNDPVKTFEEYREEYEAGR